MGQLTATSRLTAKYQATIPRPVRHVLGLHRGDRVAFVVRNNQVRLRKMGKTDLEYAQALEPTLSEWSSRHDEESYRDL